MLDKLMDPTNYVVGTDIFKEISDGAKTLNDSLQIIGPILFVVSIAAGALMFIFGRRGAEGGKAHIWNVLMGVILFVAAASLVTTLFSLFGATPEGIV